MCMRLPIELERSTAINILTNAEIGRGRIRQRNIFDGKNVAPIKKIHATENSTLSILMSSPKIIVKIQFLVHSRFLVHVSSK